MRERVSQRGGPLTPQAGDCGATDALGPVVGLGFSLAVRAALFETGADISDPAIVSKLLADRGLREPSRSDVAAVEADLDEGRARGVVGSPHFFTAGGDYFCPTLQIRHDDDGYQIEFDASGFEAFMRSLAMS